MAHFGQGAFGLYLILNALDFFFAVLVDNVLAAASCMPVSSFGVLLWGSDRGLGPT